MRDLYIKNGQGFLLIYSITNRQTLQDIQPMRDQIVRLKGGENVPMILVGNKCDVYDEREVSQDEGQQMADRWHCPFYETSAKTRHNVNETFAEVVRLINIVNQKQKTKKCCTIAYRLLVKQKAKIYRKYNRQYFSTTGKKRWTR